MIGNLMAIHGRLKGMWWGMLLLVATMWLGQGRAAATDGRWLGALMDGPSAALTQPLAWRAALDKPAVRTPASAETRARVIEAFGRAPLHFEPNRGQMAEPVQFLARTPGYQLWLTPAEAVLALRGRGAMPPATVRMQLVGEGANRAPVLAALDALPAHSNYYLGNDPQRWQTDVPHFARVRYEQVYPGVDWVLYGNPRQLEYDFVVAPGTDPNAIRLRFAGADETRIAANGELVVTVAGREVLHSSPTIYQTVDGEKREIGGRYVLRESADAAPVVGFEIAAYDPKLPLVIDPVVYFTFVGGMPDDPKDPDTITPGIGGDDLGWSIMVDSTGNAYITGHTSTNNAHIEPGNNFSKTFPVSANAINRSFTAGTDVFVTRLDSAGTIIYSTYFGGSAYESGYGIAADSVGNAYVTGYTNSRDFPVRSTAALVNESVAGMTITTLSPLPDAIVGAAYPETKFSATGDPSAWSLDPSTPISNLPPSLRWDPALPGLRAGTPIEAETGTYNFIVRAAKFIPAPSGGLIEVISRKTFSLTIGRKFEGALNRFNGGTQDAFVAKIDASGTLGYSAYLGGSGNEAGLGISVDPLGRVSVTGYTNSPNFPKAGILANGEDAFIAKVDETGTKLPYSRLMRFPGNDRGRGIVLDSAGANAYITGFRTIAKPDNQANEAAFIAKIDNATGSIRYTRSLDGPGNERGLAIALDSTAGVYITGYTNSTSGIATPGAYDTAFNGPANSRDAFVAKYTDTGTQFTLAYATYLGGYSNEAGYGIVVDGFGNAYVGGETFSPNFPMVSSDDSNQAKGEAFLSQLSADGKKLLYSTFWGGDENDSGRGLGKDFANDIYLVGYTNSPKAGFSLGPITPYRDYSGGADAFVVKFSIPFSDTDYSLSAKPQGGGSGQVTSIPEGIGQTAACQIVDGVLIANADCDASYPTGTMVTLTAVPGASSVFVGWSGSGSGDCAGSSALTCPVKMDAAKIVVANFSKTQKLTVKKAGTGKGKVTSSPAGIDCGDDCTEDYRLSTTVRLTAVPDSGSVLTLWGGDCAGTVTHTCVVTMGAVRNVTVTFEPAPLLTVTTVGSGTVTSNPAGINCGTDCTETYAAGTTVTLTATPAAGFRFSGWSGACTGTGNCAVTMTAARNVTATFTALQRYTLTVAKAGSGSGTVASDPVGINCGSDCSETYTANTVVTLTAVANSGSVFAGWNGACTGGGACVVTMTAAKSVIATFNLASTNLPDLVVPALSSPASGQQNTGRTVSFALQVRNQGQVAAGAFRVGLYLSRDPAIDFATDIKAGNECLFNSLGVGITASCSSNFNLPRGLTSGVYYLGAWADPYNAITESSEINNGRATTNTVTVYTLTATKTGSGAVTSVPSGINCGGDCVAAFLKDATATLTATPATGWQFAGWSGCDTASGATCTVKMTAARTVRATFKPTLTVTRTGNGTVTSSPAGINCGTTCVAPFTLNGTVTLTAIPASGQQFKSWTGCTTTSGATCTVNMTAPKTVNATFGL